MPRAFWVAASSVSLFFAACRPSTSDRTGASDRAEPGGPADQQHTTSPQEEPDTTPPAGVSHGEAKIGGPEAELAPVPARLAPAERTRLHRIRLEMSHAPIAIAPAVRYAAWTFGGTVPGPALRVRQGDTVDFTLVNRANIPHSMDFHAAEIAPSRYYVNVMPGDSLHYRFVARQPGAFMYHCGTAPAAMHIANGMYGALVVDP
ncbi:MAG: multicopper oxidase domain-containing protein, partial [Gemmatimonadales bacterium]